MWKNSHLNQIRTNQRPNSNKINKYFYWISCWLISTSAPHVYSLLEAWKWGFMFVCQCQGRRSSGMLVSWRLMPSTPGTRAFNSARLQNEPKSVLLFSRRITSWPKPYVWITHSWLWRQSASFFYPCSSAGALAQPLPANSATSQSLYGSVRYT